MDKLKPTHVIVETSADGTAMFRFLREVHCALCPTGWTSDRGVASFHAAGIVVVDQRKA